MPQPNLNKIGQPDWQVAYITRGHQHRKKRRRAQQKQEWMAMDNDAIYVPIAESCVRSQSTYRRCRQ